MSGMMVEGMKDNGWITRCMGKVHSHGRMGDGTMGSIKKTRKMGKVLFPGLMGASIVAVGRMVSSMDWELSCHLPAKPEEVSGMTVRE